MESNNKELKLLKVTEDLYEIINNKKVIIYGAGMVATVIISYLAGKHMTHKIFCIAVADKKNNPDEILGVPVCQINEIIEYTEYAQILIATLENKSQEIFMQLCEKNFNDIVAVSNLLYAYIRQEIPSYEYEILNLQKNTRMHVLSIEEELKNIKSTLNQIKSSIQYSVQYYEQTISKKNYPRLLAKWYRERIGRELNLDDPKTYNEKIQWIKLYGLSPIMTELTDKYKVREWIKNEVGEQYLTNLLGVWGSYEEIDFEKLPEKFVLKCNHGCGYNIIVKNKESLDKLDAKNMLTKWLNSNFTYEEGGLQLQYANIEPLIIAEEYLENEEGDLFDYKFWCFEGKVEFIMFLSERNKKLKMNNYDRDWNLLPFTYDYEQSTRKIPRPEKLEEMISIAEKLAKGFHHVRVDLYLLNNGDIKFGEMTFTSANGVCKWSDEEVNRRLGDLIKLDIDK